MILCEFTPSGGSMARCSLADKPLTYQWMGYIKSLSSVKLATEKAYGGYAKPTFSDLTFFPELFESGSWPPADTAACKLQWTDSDEAAAVTIFDGTATLSGYDRSGVKYNLAMPEFSAKVNSGTVFSGTLNSVMTTLCGASYLNLTLNTAGARGTSPAVSFTLASDTQAIDLASDLCAFFTHAFYISGTTLYLLDMLGSGTPQELTEFDVLPCSYEMANPVSLVKSTNGSVAGSRPNGKELSLSTEYCTTGNLTANLTNVKTVVEKDVARIACHIDSTKPTILDHLTLLDESTPQNTTTTALATAIIYNFDDETMEIEALGALS